jgi:hypothetical protein
MRPGSAAQTSRCREAMPVTFVGFLALGTSVENHRLVEAKGYVRPSVCFSGHPNPDQTPLITGLVEPRHEFIRYGGIMDQLTGGRLLAYWEWLPPHFEIRGDGVAYPCQDVMVSLEYRLNLGVNSARTGRPGSVSVDPGSVIGSVSGRPMTSGVRLAIEQNTGIIVSNAAATKAADAARRA